MSGKQSERIRKFLRGCTFGSIWKPEIVKLGFYKKKTMTPIYL